MPAGVSAWTPLANLTLGSTATSITFSSISGSYRDLVFVFTQPSSGTQVRPLVQLNSDTNSANYFEVVAVGNGSTTSSLTYSNTGFDPINRYSSYLNAGQIVLHFLDYVATDKHKSVLYRGDDSTQAAIMGVGRWANTAAVTQVRFQGSGGNSFPVGTSVALYGVSA